ncbi:MAG: ethanolamine utilization protein EutN [Planctomycetota bacterium]|jgi:ethanolamine utilization protein EutN
MFLGRVIGEIWATQKDATLEGRRLLVIEPLDTRQDPSAPKVSPVVAADTIGADTGEHVVVAFGKAARVACGGDGDLAFEAAVVGIVDDFNIPSAPKSWYAGSESAGKNAAGKKRVGGGT